jgi:hypothetical protein
MSKPAPKKPMAVKVPREQLYQRKVERMFQGQADYNKSLKKR